MQPNELKELCEILNPNRIEGRLILITRYGHDKIGSMLPAHIKAVQESGIPVVWQCDGVHGNTVTASNKLKTRKFDDVMGECARAADPPRERQRPCRHPPRVDGAGHSHRVHGRHGGHL